jgi:hypothetical protein
MTGAVDGEILSTHNFFIDAFGIPVTHGTKNKLDLPSTYDFRPERYALYVNGSRVQPESTSFTNHFTDQPSTYDLEPDAGDRVELRIRERPRYVPGFEILFGLAWYMGSTLPSGGKIKLGLRDEDNKFQTEYTASDVEAVIESGNTETVRQSIGDGYMVDRDISHQEKLQQPQIDRGLANMYGVGNYKPGKSYLSPVASSVVSPSVGESIDAANIQKNQNMLAEHIRDNGENVQDDVGVGNLADVNTEEFNMHLSIELDLTNASSAATLRVLSQQYVVLGDVTPTTSPKPLTFFDLGGSIGPAWNDAVMLMRTDPTRDNVDVDMTVLGITPSAEMELVAMAFEPDDIAAENSQSLSTIQSNFVPPEEHYSFDGINSVLEVNAVNAPYSYPTQTVTNAKGNSVVVPDKARLMNRASESAGSNQGGGTPAAGERTETKRTIFNDDWVLLVPRGAPGIGTTETIEITDIATEQDQ